MCGKKVLELVGLPVLLQLLPLSFVLTLQSLQLLLKARHLNPQIARLSSESRSHLFKLMLHAS